MVFLGLRGRMGLFQVAYNGYVWKTLLPQRHPERSRGIFLAHRYSAVCETAENGNPSAKGARKSRVQGRFLAALEMTAGGMSLFHVAYNGYVWKALFLYCHPDRSGGIFLAHRYSAVCETAEKGKPFAKGARKSRVQGRFLAALEMRVWGNEGSHKFEISNKLTNVKESHLNMSIIMCYIKTSIKAPMLLY